ncbi:MAG: hypothetical protein HXN77_05085 [Prevotella pallens]|uniref:hypothetical protein n=1 Tax=Prevotella pallens TaxID=60133 RepID=UPI001CB56B6D|nr:hypothetical protein [Prevotella pallens]MBF1489860.1 hypothetical protein [Prevotella pallens]
MEFLNIKQVKEGHKEKVLLKGTIKGKVFYYVQAVEYDGLTGLMVENTTEDCADYEDALQKFETVFSRMNKADRLYKARAIKQRIRSKIYQFEKNSEDFAPSFMIKARRKIGRWIAINEPQRAFAKRDFWDCML